MTFRRVDQRSGPVTGLLLFPVNGGNQKSLRNYRGVRSMGKGNQTFMGGNSEIVGGSLAPYGADFSPFLPFIPSTISPSSFPQSQ